MSNEFYPGDNHQFCNAEKFAAQQQAKAACELTLRGNFVPLSPVTRQGAEVELNALLSNGEPKFTGVYWQDIQEEDLIQHIPIELDDNRLQVNTIGFQTYRGDEAGAAPHAEANETIFVISGVLFVDIWENQSVTDDFDMHVLVGKIKPAEIDQSTIEYGWTRDYEGRPRQALRIITPNGRSDIVLGCTVQNGRHAAIKPGNVPETVCFITKVTTIQAGNNSYNEPGEPFN